MSAVTAPGSRSESMTSGAPNVKDYVLQRAAEFTMIPAAAMKAMEIGRNPACTVQEYASAIERDVRLAADLLCMANSAVYCSGAPSGKLQDAVRRLGLKRCQGLILSTCTASLMRNLPFEQAQRREALWRHGYMTAVIARHLNDKLQLGFAGEEFTAGLMHDLGRSLLVATMPDFCAQLDAVDAERAADRIALERAVLDTDHCEIGAAFGACNGLPASLVAAIAHHHAPEVESEHQRLVAMIAVADFFAHQLERGEFSTAEKLADLECLPLLATTNRVQQALTGVNESFVSQALDEARQFV